MKQFVEYSDIDIKQKILQGESKLFEILIRRNNSVLYKTGRAYGYNHEDTQDLLQETFISAYTNLPSFENRSSFRTWIIKIMLNNCYRRQQKFSYKNELTHTDAINEKSIPMYSDNTHTDTNKVIVSHELNNVIENAMQKLPFDYRLVFSLREISGFNVAEAAELLKISEVNVKVRLNRAKVMLRREIEKTYTAEDIFEFNLIYCDRMVNRVMDKIKDLPGCFCKKHSIIPHQP
jgi:RNA polymerase sigma factor (sigma-70 family)